MHRLATTTLALHYYLLHCVRADAILPWRNAVDHQELCVVLLQDYERVRCRGRRRSCFSLPRPG